MPRYKIDGKDPTDSAYMHEGVPGYHLQDQALNGFQNYKISFQYYVSTGEEAATSEQSREQPKRF